MNIVNKQFNESRMTRVNQARERWKQQLFDLGRRNNLLYFRDLKTGSLRIPPEAFTSEPLMAFLHDGSPLGRDFLLFGGSDPGVVLGKLRAIRDQARANREEKGIQTLYLALGMATWHTPDHGRPPAAPIWLVPVDIEIAGTDSTRVTLKKSGDVTLNPLLSYVLEQQFGMAMGSGDDEDIELPRNLAQGLAAVGEKTRFVEGFQAEEAVLVGNFSFQKLAMVNDLTALGDVLVENDVVAALAGDEEARQALLPPVLEEPDKETVDRPPDDDYTVLDADSSQLRVIWNVLKGRTGVVSGPPGTGKSQTIANLLAECAARGKSVLFVAEKRAALDVVLGRLHEAGLDHLALDLEGAERSKQAIARQLEESLQHIRSAQDVQAAPVHRAFTARRDGLNAYVWALHKSRDPWGLSVYDMYGHVLTTPKSMRILTRLDAATLSHFTESLQRHVAERLKELGGLKELKRSPWFHLSLKTPAEATTAIALVARLADNWQRFAEVSDPLVLSRFSFAELSQWMKLQNDMQILLDGYTHSIYTADIDRLEQALAPGTGGLTRVFHRLFDRTYQEATRELKAHQHKGQTLNNPLEDVQKIKAQCASWKSLGYDRVPVLPVNFEEILSLWRVIQTDCARLAELGFNLNNLLPAQCESLLQDLTSDSVTPHQVVTDFEIQHELRNLALGGLLDEIQRRNLNPEDWVRTFYDTLYRSALDHIFASDGNLSRFSRAHHEQMIDEFRQYDRERIALNRNRVARMHAQAAVSVLNEHPEQEQLIRQEANKRSRHLPLRKFLQRAPEALLALRPCWVASPLQVSQLLAPQKLFDLILFDEASQVLPEDAIPALARGRQAVVAGDRHQLPPTTFFTNSLEEDNEEDALAYEGFESILDLMSSLTPSWPLEWHYRSRDERLIAFSNRHIYSDSLITFPGYGHSRPIEHVVVPQVVGRNQDTDSMAAEADHVAAEVMRHAREHPKQSLGVITMGIKHANRVQMALDERLRQTPELAGFFDDKRSEPFFIKNLERVQGDERDVIFLSVGYGKDSTGRLLYHFGPLLQTGGERRLNVAITRARHRMVVISSFDHRDMDPERKTSRGVMLLREFLHYAATGGDILREIEEASNVELNPFELLVQDALQAQGLRLVPQWGVSRYRLDFAVQHPERPGQFVLAIECDGASYHSAPSARDRDRLRQQQLEALGWRFHRIWSTEWFRDPAGETARAVSAYEDALAKANEPAPLPPALAAAKTKKQEPRGPKPPIMVDVPIDQRSNREILGLLDWIQSDGRLRTHEELLHELVEHLGYKRRGPRIEARLRSILQVAERQKTHGR